MPTVQPPKKIMYRTTIVAVFLVIVCAACGCTPSQTAKKIASLRKGGDPVGARELAIRVLTDDADQMEIWRELAMSDLDLCHNAKNFQLEPDPFLLEASLISLAVYEHEKGKPGSKWETAGRLAAAEGRALVDNLLKNLPIHTERNEYTRTEEWDPLGIGGNGPTGIIRRTETTTEKTADLREAGPMLHQAVVMIEFMRKLPQDQKELDMIIQVFENKLDELPGSVSNITASYLDNIRKSGEASMKQALQQATDDLKNDGYFQLPTILQNTLNETP
jgi:hypothetical protein